MKKIDFFPKAACFTACLLSASIWMAPEAAGQGWQADGLYWKSIGTNPSGGMTAGAASSANNAYFGSSTNQLYHYNGSSLTSNALGWNTFAATSAWNSAQILNIAFDNSGNLHVAGQNGAYAFHDGTQWHGIQLTTPTGTNNPLMRDGFWIDPATGTSYIAGWSNSDPLGTDSSEIFRLTDNGFGGYFVQSLSTGYAGGSGQSVGAIVGTGLDNMWIASSQGRPRHSTDGGNTWSNPITSSPFNPSRAFMINSDTIVYGSFATATNNVAIWDGNGDPTKITLLDEQPGHQVNRIYATGTDSIWVFQQSWINRPSGDDLPPYISFFDGEEWHTIEYGAAMNEEYRFMFGADGAVFVLPNSNNDIYMGMIPEPGTWALLMGLSVLGLSLLFRRRRSRIV